MPVLPLPPQTNNLAQFAVPLLGASPTGRYCLIGESRGADESGEYGTLGSGLLQLLPVQTQWAYWGGTSSNGHLRSSIISIGGVDTPPGGTLQGSGALNLAPCTVHSIGSTPADGTPLGTIDWNTPGDPHIWKLTVSGGSGTFRVGEVVSQATSTAFGTVIGETGGFLFVAQPLLSPPNPEIAFDTTHAVTGGTSTATRNVSAATIITTGDLFSPTTGIYDIPSGTASQAGGPLKDIYASPGQPYWYYTLSSRLRPFHGGDPHNNAKCFIRLIMYQTAASAPTIRFLARRNSVNSTPDTNPATFPVGVGFKTIDLQLDAAKGRVSGFVGAVGTAGKEIHVAGMGLYANSTNTIPAGPRWFTMGKSGISLEDFCQLLGDDAGDGLVPYTDTANARTWMSLMSGGDGSTSGPTDYILDCSNRGSHSFSGTTENAALLAGDYSITLRLYRRIIAALNAHSLALNGVVPRILIITPEIAAYDAAPHSNATVQATIANARAWAGHYASTEYSNVSHINLNPWMGGYPIDGISRPPWMRTESEATFTHYSNVGQMVPATMVIAALQQSYYQSTGTVIDNHFSPSPRPIWTRLR